MATYYAGIQPYYWGPDEHIVTPHHQLSLSVEPSVDLAFSFCEEVRNSLISWDPAVPTDVSAEVRTELLYRRVHECALSFGIWYDGQLHHHGLTLMPSVLTVSSMSSLLGFPTTQVLPLSLLVIRICWGGLILEPHDPSP